MVFTTPAARGVDYTWNNTVGGNYNVSGSWTSAGPPGAADNATIDVAGSYTVTLNDDRSINNLTLNNAGTTFNHTSGTYTVAGTINLLSGTYHLNGGAISGGSITAAGGSRMLVGPNANRLVDVSVGAGVLDFSETGGSLRLSGTTTIADTTLNLTNGNLLGFEQTRTLTGLTVNLGSATAFSYLSVEGDNTLTLGPSVTVNATGYGYLTSNFFVGGTGVLVNQGLIEKTVAGTYLYISPSGGFNNQGTLRIAADGGTVYVASGGVNTASGVMEVQANGLLDLSGTSWANQGSVVVNGGTASLAATNWSNSGTISVTGGTVTLGGNWSNSGTIDLNGGTLNLGGSTTTAGLGLAGLTRSGVTTVNLTGQLDNTSTTLALTAATGDFRLYGGAISGGSITAAGGARLLVGANGSNRLVDVAVGAGCSTSARPAALCGCRAQPHSPTRR